MHIILRLHSSAQLFVWHGWYVYMSVKKYGMYKHLAFTAWLGCSCVMGGVCVCVCVCKKILLCINTSDSAVRVTGVV